MAALQSVLASAIKALLIISRPSSILAAILRDHLSVIDSASSFAPPQTKSMSTANSRPPKPIMTKLSKPQESKMALIISGKTSEADTKPRIRVESTVVDVLNRCHRIHTNKWPWTRWVKRLAGCELGRLARSPMFLVCLSSHSLSVVSLKAHCFAAVTTAI